ncbi:hypothetical protein JCM10449v2_002612 [Rhodotorula kratochvilovae]
MYDSTASTTDDADGEHDSPVDEVTSAGAALLAERRRREEARAARRRAKQDAASARPRMAREGSAQGRSVAEIDTERAVSHALGLSRQMPLVDGRNGLGFAFSEAEMGDAGASSRRSSRSAPASPRAATFAPRAATQRLAVTQDAGISFETDSAGSTSRRVRFEQPYRPSGRDRSGSSSHIALQPEHIVFPDSLPSPPVPPLPATSPKSFGSHRSSAASSSIYSPKSVAMSSPATSLAPSLAAPPPASPRARSPRRASGPSPRVNDLHVQRPISKVFPSAPAKPPPARSHETSSPTPSDASTISVVFPSRGREKKAISPSVAASPRHYFPSPAASATPSPSFPSRQRSAFETASPFPVRKHARSTPSSPSPFRTPVFPSHASPRVNGSPFPPPPPDSPHARYLAQMHESPTPVVAPSPHTGISPSFASNTSLISAAEPIFPSLGARLADDGVVRADPSSRRVSNAPWEVPPALAHHLLAEDDTGDELDRMMRAQRRADLSARASSKDREDRRRSIHAELARPVRGASAPPVPSLPSIPPSPLELAFDRALLDSETKRRSLGGPLLSDEVASRRTSATPTITPETAHLSVRDLRQSGSSGSDEASERASLAASTSLENGLTASVLSTGSDISSLPSFPDVPQHLAPPVPPLPTQYQVFPSVGATSIVVGGLTRPLDERDSHDRRSKGAPPSPITTSTAANRLSIVSESGVSLYEDAPSSPPALAGASLRDVQHAPVAVADGDDVAQQQTREWVETLKGGPGRSLGDIGEEPEDEDERARSPQHPLATPPSASPSTFPSPLHTRTREASATSTTSLSVPPSPHFTHGLARVPSPAPSARSAASSTAVSYTHVPPASPRSGSTHFKPRLTLGRKIGALFGGGNAHPGGAAGKGGISSRDAVLALGAGAANEHGARDAHARAESGTSTGASAGASAGGGTVPPSPVVGAFGLAPTFPTPPHGAGDVGKENVPASSSAGGGGLDALLARFEAEEKERFRGIAAARAQDVLWGRGEVAAV